LSEKVRKSETTEIEIKFAQLVYADKLNDVEIAKQCRFSARQVYRWKKRPEIIALIDELAQSDVRQAKRILQKNSKAAARALVTLIESGKVKEEEVTRKAAIDILKIAGCLNSYEEESPEGKKDELGDLLRHLDTDRLGTIVESVQRRIRVTH